MFDLIATQSRLPSDRKFGFFVSFLVLIFCLYNITFDSAIDLYAWLSFSFLTFVVSFVFPPIFRPFNIIWFKIGLMMGAVVSPLVLMVIYFVFISPLAIFLRILGRDELGLSPSNTTWKPRDKFTINFDNQF